MADHAHDDVEVVSTETDAAASPAGQERYATGVKPLDNTVYKIDKGIRKIDAGVRRISTELHKVTDKKQ